ncbi:leucyl aminopeptidase [Stratiformator vulcanicus]|uniref:Probable cytosol aminopeptidase n=1 Tax=Stratiformator vulcanicus TaxID=2527980 RepID=A0A517QZW4_9PLAN|nr:leucyl aminopeptidase [Stratiformator vulcanicus]QDT37133.1 putative cytosol aminopeptidase [Stratiformator vulcanicus]
MKCEVASTDWNKIAADWLVVGVPSEGEAGPGKSAFDMSLRERIARLRESGDLTGKLGETLALRDVPEIAAKRLLFVGIGDPKELTRGKLGKAIRTAARLISEKKTERVAFDCPQAAVDKLELDTAICTVTAEAIVGSVGQGLYQNEPKRFPFESITVLVETEAVATAAADGLQRGHVIGESINLTRELVNRPAADIYPESVAERVRELAEHVSFEVEVLELESLQREQMGSLLAVAQGSDKPPRVVVMKHNGATKPDAPTLALVGKGVTFDSGGLSMKPSEGMKDMKCDMAGGATVIGVIAAAARLKLPVNLIGYVGLVENMVSGNSYKLGDVLKSRSGITIEVLNTDAEGRLVLADVLDYAVEKGCDHLIDLATLTGACVVALGDEVVGAFTNNEVWCNEVRAAAHLTGEHVWELPMHEHFAELLKSDVADCKNVGPRWGGAITAAKFLEQFVDETPWVHLDIAGPAYAQSSRGDQEGGGTGAMVRSLIELAAEYGANRG